MRLSLADKSAKRSRRRQVSALQRLSWGFSENALAPVGLNWFSTARSRVWWNWQTRYFEVVVAKAVQVQVLPRAPTFLRILWEIREKLSVRRCRTQNRHIILLLSASRKTQDVE